MNKIVYLVVALFIIESITILAQDSYPKREFRGIWVATVVNLDWPSSRTLSVDAQKLELTKLLDDIKQTGFNTVIFQVRPECDALYNSPYEPWSYWLTGTQGKAPDPYYDPLEFAVEEAHKRGLEIHAWFNPYRAERSAGSYSLSQEHVINKHPDWILQVGSVKFLNPGLQEVRDYVTSVFMDVVRRYDVDGIHIDDYFYVEGISNQDAATFSEYPRGFTNIADWRRDNVNILIKEINDNVKVIKPWVKWGVSPRGIWRPGYPAGVTGNDNYNSIYCDAITWLQQQSLDYLTPQLYWPYGGGQDYGKLMAWWADSVAAHERHFYPGHAAYRIPEWTASEVPNQIRANRNNPKTQGSIFFRALFGVLDNPKGFADSLMNDLYKYPAILPSMDWKDQINPNTPLNFKYGPLANKRGDGLIWNAPSTAADGDSAFMYAVYKFDVPSVQESDLENSANLNNVVGTNYLEFKNKNDATGGAYYAVTALDRNYNESPVSEVIPVSVEIPEKPGIYLPVDLAVNQRDTIEFTWENTPHSNYNRLQVATDENFTDLVINQNSIADTFKTVTGFKGLTTYYWRVSATNLAGESEYSEVRSFTTGFPLPPNLVSPENQLTDVSLTPELIWNSSQTAENYLLQVAEGTYISPSKIIIDTLISDTTFSINTGLLKEDQFYVWAVGADNEYGFSGLKSVYKFKTEGTTSIAERDNTVPENYELKQNYPNPFNPTTTISFGVPESGYTTLRIYNVLGQQVKELVNKNLNPGSYSVEFDALNLPSGMFIYILQSGHYLLSKKMMLIK